MIIKLPEVCEYMNLLRWLLFIPAGLVASFLVELFWPIIVDWLFLNLKPFLYISSLISGAVFVYVSVKIAPTWKEYVVSKYMCLLLLLALVFAVYIQLSSEGSTPDITLIPILHLVGGIFITYKIRKNDF